MIIRNANINDIPKMVELWNRDIAILGFYQPLDLNKFINVFTKDPDFSYDGVFVAYNEEELIGYVMGFIRSAYAKNPDNPGCLNSIVVKKEYRKQGIGSALLTKVEEFFKNSGRNYVQAYNYLPLCYEWYIPGFDKHNHPCAPAVRVNSEEYFFLLHHGYAAVGFEDAFHLPLSEYEISDSIQNILDTNAEDGIVIEYYDENKHFGIDEFYEDINALEFEKVIRSNLALEKPYPFLVVAKNNKVVGWTGALWNEPTGRGHFDGIIISESVRGRGLGKALFSMLAYKSKLNGAKFMTFYTGLNNHARYIYMGAGFKIIQTYALMKKKVIK
ncbi:MAG: GNAT family N-acetyltransferase [Bacilli bacterium]|nr:GNAT family N-acetyltransferase [Bacilli bacterium]